MKDINKIKVSILVPAYNVEAYLDECLQSLLSQTLKEIEMVVVDDGSTDQTATIAERYAATDPRIRVIRLPEHQGVSHARNVCLAQAQGEYLSFVDSDDTITSTAMEELYHKAKATDTDIVLGSILYCYPDGKRTRVGDKSSIFHSNIEILSGQECFIRMQQKGCYVPMVCGNLYRTAFIKAHPQLHFEGEFHEDEYFTPFALYEATRVTDFKKDFYHYRQRPESIMHKGDNINLRIKALKCIINYQKAFADQLPQNSFKEAMWQNISRLYRSAGKLQESLSTTTYAPQLVCYIANNQQLHELLALLNTLNRPVLMLCTPEVDDEVEVNENVSAISLEGIADNTLAQFLETLEPEGILVTDDKNTWTEYAPSGTPVISIDLSKTLDEQIASIHREAPCRYLTTTDVPKLHIGCGPFVMEGWLNVDINCYRPDIRYLDAGKPYPFPDHSFDYIYTEHLFEHLSIEEQTIMLQECYRILKPGGRMRLAMPNLHFLMELYLHPDKECNRRYLVWSYRLFGMKQGVPEVMEKDYPIHVINNFFRLWGHQFIHTPESLENLAKGIGFQGIRPYPIGSSDTPALQGLEKHGQNIPAWANELETFVVEMIKAEQALPTEEETDDPKISLIVPVYNGEKYIETCLESIIAQSLDELEVILVNDGSTDSSGRIMKEYADSYSNFIYVEQENRGLSEARNAGLQHTHGKYIAFLDGDDLLPKEALLHLYRKAEETCADMVAGNVVTFGNKEEQKDYATRNRETRFTISGEAFLTEAVTNRHYVPMVYNYLYRRSFIEQHGLRFEPGILHEDELWTPIALTKAKRVASIHCTTYLYRQHGASIMSSSKAERRIASLEVVVRKSEEFMERDVMGDNAKEAIKERVQILNRILQNLNNKKTPNSIDTDKKHLLIFTRKNSASRYGVGTYVKQLARSLDLSIWDVHVMELYASGSELTLKMEDNIHYIHFPDTATNRGDADEIYQKSVFYWIANHYPHENLYCHFNFTADGILATLLKEHLNARIAFTLHYMEWKFYLDGKDEKHLQRILVQPQSEREKELVSSFQQEKDFLHQCCDRIIAASHHSYELLQNVYGINLNRIAYIPHGLCDTYKIRNEQELKDIRKKYRFSEKERIILYVGRLTEDKGLTFLIAAFKLLQEQYTDIRLVIAGGGDNGRFLKIANPLWNRIIFTGYLEKEQLDELYAISTLGVVPSFHEELGYVAIEMLMHKLPMVCSDASGLKEVSDHGRYAVMIDDWCNSKKVLSLKKAMEKVLSDNSYQEELREKGRNRYLTEYSQSIYQKKIGLFYK